MDKIGQNWTEWTKLKKGQKRTKYESWRKTQIENCCMKKKNNKIDL